MYEFAYVFFIIMYFFTLLKVSTKNEILIKKIVKVYGFVQKGVFISSARLMIFITTKSVEQKVL